MSKTGSRKSYWRLILLILFGVLLLVVVIGWFYAGTIAGGRVKSQLDGLALGEVTIGGTTVGMGGVDSRDVKFFREPGDSEPWLEVGRLSITQPLSKLIAGDDDYQQIELADIIAKVNIDQLPGSDATGGAMEIALPAQAVKLSNANIVVTDDLGRTVDVNGVNASVTQSENRINVDAQIDDFGGSWTVTGFVDSVGEGQTEFNSNPLSLSVASDSIEVGNGEWQQWPIPGLPPTIGNYLEVGGRASANVQIETDGTKPLEISGTAHVHEADLRLPTFDLPIDIASADLSFTDERIAFTDANATVDGTDRYKLSGQTGISEFPIVTTFAGDFERTDMITVRKIVPAIPETLRGKGTGPLNGVVTIEQSLRTVVQLNADATAGPGTSYGQIRAESADVAVKIESLIFNEQQQYESIAGAVDVDARAVDQPVSDILETFELAAINDQLEVVASGSGSAKLHIPLPTADKLETWNMTIDATAPAGTVSGQAIRDVTIAGKMANGNFLFDNVTAIPVADGDSKNDGLPEPAIRLTMDWPIAAVAEHPETGKLTIDAERVQPGWLIDLANRQFEILDPEFKSPSESDDAIGAAITELDGTVNFSGSIDIGTAAPEDLANWKSQGSVTDSRLTTDTETLENVSAQWNLAEQRLVVQELAGEFVDSASGSLRGDLTLDLKAGTLSDAQVNADDLPIRWLAMTSRRLDPSIETTLTEAGIDLNDAEALAGELDAQVRYIDRAGDANTPWGIEVKAESASLKIAGNVVSDVAVDATVDGQNIVVKEANGRFGNGFMDGSGRWDLESQLGEADLKWQQLPLAWLSQLQSDQPIDVGGSTSGSLKLVSQNDEAGEAKLTIDGSIAGSDIEYAGFRTRTLAFDIKSDGQQVRLDNFTADRGLLDLKLVGQIDTRSPYTFEAKGNIEAVPLSRIFANASVTEAVGETLNMSGVADGNFVVSGSLDPVAWTTTGDLAIKDPRFDDAPLSDISAKWKAVGNDLKSSTAVVKAFGGSVTLKEFNQQPSRIRVDVSEIDATELSSLAALPVELTGSISGDASLNDWDLAETRWAEFNLESASFTAGPVELGDFAAALEYRSGAVKYSVDGRMLAGKITGSGETEIPADLQELQLPVKIQLINAQLNSLSGTGDFFRSIRPLSGMLSVSIDATASMNELPTARGRIVLDDVSWQNRRLTRQVSTDVNLGGGVAEFSNLSVDLKRGQISGRARVPVTAESGGNYQIDVRHFDIGRLAEIINGQSGNITGLLDARLSGQIGTTINGQGTVGLERTEVLGLVGRSLKVPIEFQIQPQQGSGVVRLRRSRFQLFNGDVSGSAELEFGRVLNLNTDLTVSRVETELLIAAFSGVNQQDQGQISGRLKLSGRGIRSARDLRGSFAGSLDRASAFQLPVLSNVATLLGNNQIQRQDFDSDDIAITLNNGRVDVGQLNFSNSLASVAISGEAFIDGRLNLDVAARVETLETPSLLQELLGSPVAQLSGSPTAFFAQAADFLSDRLVFLKISGTASRPQVRVNTGQQIREESIRYFLRGSQILPNVNTSNN